MGFGNPLMSGWWDANLLQPTTHVTISWAQSHTSAASQLQDWKQGYGLGQNEAYAAEFL